MATSAHARSRRAHRQGPPAGHVSRFLKDHAAVGLVVGLSPAAGAFTLPHPPRPPCMRGGSGITPVMAMLRTLCAEGHDGRVTFVHYALCSRPT